MEFEIVLLGPDSIELLSHIAADVFDNPIDAEQLHAFVSDERHFMYLAVADDHVIGMVSAVEYFHPDKPPQLWINEVGVSPDYQNNGVGRELVEAMIDLAEDRGCIYAWLGTDTDNEAAQACFGSISEDDEPLKFLLYEWELED